MIFKWSAESRDRELKARRRVWRGMLLVVRLRDLSDASVGWFGLHVILQKIIYLNISSIAIMITQSFN